MDTEFSEADRASYIGEIRQYLPAYLSKASTSTRVRPADLGPVLDLRPRDLDAVLAVHKGLSDPVVQFVNGLSRGMRAPFTSTIQTHELSPTVRGPIDWGATIKQKTQRGISQPVFVIRPRQREFDNAANRALAHGLRCLEELYEEAVGALPSSDSDTSRTNDWHSELHGGLLATQQAQKMHWIRSVPARRLPPDAFRSLGAVRKRFYSNSLAQLLRYLVAFDEDPDPQVVAEAVIQRYFTPDQDWRLFEAVVALRIDAALESAGSTDIERGLLVRGQGGPYAIHRFADTTVQLWYQHWAANRTFQAPEACTEAAPNPQPRHPTRHRHRADRLFQQECVRRPRTQGQQKPGLPRGRPRSAAGIPDGPLRSPSRSPVRMAGGPTV